MTPHMMNTMTPPTPTIPGLDEFVASYIETALWSSTGDNDKPLDNDYDASDVAGEHLMEIKAECKDFLEYNQVSAWIDQSGLSMSSAGHNFWLTRNRHGAGFWDVHSQTTCAAYEREQAVAMISRDFSKREALDLTCQCPYHACQRLTEAAHTFGSSDVSPDDDGQLHFS